MQALKIPDTVLSAFPLTPLSANKVFNKTPKFLVEAAKKKYGKKIKVIGATKEGLDDFWSQVGYKVNPGQDISRPEEIAKSVVNIDMRTHSNHSKKRLEDGPYGPKKSDDWYDDFQITSQKSVDESRSKSKSYNLRLENTKSFSLGGNIPIGAGFFNLAGIGVNPGGSYSKTKNEVEDQKLSHKTEESLSQGYEIVDTLKVPPNTTVKAKITTYAVTYQSTTVIRLVIDPRACIEVQYCSRFSKTFLRGRWKSTGKITAEDLFGEEEDYEEADENVTFTHEGKVSYVGEEVEIHKIAF